MTKTIKSLDRTTESCMLLKVLLPSHNTGLQLFFM